jgi:small multidrug resistance pump
LAYAYLSVAILGEVAATTSLKTAGKLDGVLAPAIVVIGYAVAVIFLNLSLQTIPVGIAYAIWAGTGTALIALSGYFVYQQALDTPALLGIGLILAGVIAVNGFSRTVVH